MSAVCTGGEHRFQVLGYPVDLVNCSSALALIETAWQQQKSFQIVTLNAEMIMAAQQDPDLERIIRHTQLVIPDGAGIVWSLRLLGHKAERLPGIDLAQAALSLAASQNIRVALLGARPAIIEQLRSILPKLYPGLKLVFIKDGYFNPDQEERIVNEISQTNPQLLLLALGVPKQEYFIDRWSQVLPCAVTIGVGGSFDVWAGAVQRAPESYQRLNLEWFYRLIKEPWRFWRMISTLPKFALLALTDVLRQKFHSN